MKFFTFVIAGSIALVNSAAIEKRDSTTVVNDIAAVKSQLQVVYNDVVAFQGGAAGTLQALNIQAQSNQVATLLEKAASDAAASLPFTTSGSASVALAIAGLTPLVYATLDELVVKEPAFSTAALGLPATGIVYGVLQKLKQSTDDFGGNVTTKLTPETQRLAPLIIGEINYHFVQSLQAYNASSF